LIAHLAKSRNSGDGLPTIPLSFEDVFLFPPNGMNAIYIVYLALTSLLSQHDVVGYG
jgi:hypothetical protein